MPHQDSNQPVRGRHPASIALALAVTLSLTLGATFIARRSEWSTAREDMARISGERAVEVHELMSSWIQTLGDIGAFFASSQDVSPEEFATFAGPIRVDHPEILMLGWAPVVGDHATETTPLRYVESGSEWQCLRDFDLSSVPAFRAALEHSQDEHDPICAAADVLDPSNSPQRRWVFMAVETPESVTQHAAGVSGYLAMLIDMSTSLKTRLTEAARVGVDSCFGESTRIESPALVCSHRSRSSASRIDPCSVATLEHADFVRSRSFSIGGRDWTLTCASSPSYLASYRSWLPWAVFVAGILCSALLAGFLDSNRRHSRRLQEINVGLQREIEQRRVSEAALTIAKDQAEAANRAKAQFLANMSHELRTPLNGILGMTQLTLDTQLGPEQREYLGIANTCASLLLTLVDDVLDFAGVQEGTLQLHIAACDVRRLAEDATRMAAAQAEQKGLELACDVERGIPPNLVADASRVRQVLNDLIENAIKFTDRGKVVVRVEAERDDSSAHATLLFSVTDSGPGLPASVRAGLFTAFTQADSSMSRRHGGMGLGLAICKHLVSLMGGEIAAENLAQGGCRVWFRIRLERTHEAIADAALPKPREQAAQPVALPFAPAPLAAPQRARVLLVEDNVVNQRVAGLMLKKAGFGVEVAPDGRAAIEALREGTYDLVLMDCQMPIMDGFEATREIRRRSLGGSHLPVIALTAHSLDGDRERCLQAGMDDYLTKPIKSDERHAAIHRALLLPAVQSPS